MERCNFSFLYDAFIYLYYCAASKGTAISTERPAQGTDASTRPVSGLRCAEASQVKPLVCTHLHMLTNSQRPYMGIYRYIPSGPHLHMLTNSQRPYMGISRYIPSRTVGRIQHECMVGFQHNHQVLDSTIEPPSGNTKYGNSSKAYPAHQAYSGQ